MFPFTARAPRRRPTFRFRPLIEVLEDRLVPTNLPTGFTEAAVLNAGVSLSSPTAMEFAPDGRLFVTQQGGTLQVVKNGTLHQALSLPVDSAGERGLLGIAFDPSFTTAGHNFVYLYWTVAASGSLAPHNVVSRFTVSASDPDALDPASRVDMLTLNDLSGATNHNGGAMHFGADGKLFVAVGENANPSNSQTLGNLLGKILRIDVSAYNSSDPVNSVIPTDNPFYTQASGVNRDIYALGFRNPFTFAVQPGTGRLFVNDVGQNTWEEIDDTVAGGNYGWPGSEGFRKTGDPATTVGTYHDPQLSYSHSGSPGGIAIAGGAFYNPTVNQFGAQYTGKYFYADLGGNYIRVFDPSQPGSLANPDSSTSFATGIGSNPVDIKVGADGSLYYLSRGKNNVFRITFTGSQAPAIDQQPANLTISVGQPATFTVSATGTAPLTYRWQRNGTDISGATAASYTLTTTTADNGATFRAIVTNAFGSATSQAATLTVTANHPPAPTILTPVVGTHFNMGNTISYSGSATDPEDGTLGGGAFTWSVSYFTGAVERPFVPATTGSSSGSFTLPTLTPYTKADVFYRIYLTVKDSAGASTTVFRDILPNTVTFTVGSNTGGVQLLLDGQPIAPGTAVAGVVGFQRTLSVASPQSVNGIDYSFLSWSDGGAQSHNISTPASATTYTASFTAAPANFPMRVNFQLAGAPTPTGYLADTGAAFGNRGTGLNYGWNIDNSATSRDRNAGNSPDQRYDTLLHLQKPTNPNAFWEIAVANGTYLVHVVAGDPSNIDSVYKLDVEGVRAIDATPTSAVRWFDNVVQVTVTDGRLTLSNASGSSNNKIDFIELKPVGATTGTIGSYAFNEGTGTTTADASPSGNHGTLTGGVAWTTGHAGAGLNFDGATGYVQLATDLNQNLGGTATVAFWIKTTQTGNDVTWQAPGVTGVESVGDGNDIFYGWIDASGRIGVQAGDVAGAKSNAAINDDQWHHVALTRDADSGTVEVYVDGMLNGSAISDKGVKTTAFRSIGRVENTAATPTHFKGALDDVQFFNRVLSASEIQALAH